MNSKYNQYTDFLKDKQFLRWQLLPDEEVSTYWRNFIEKHPEHNSEIQKAITYLKKSGINYSTLHEYERADLLERIQTTLRHENKIKKRKLFWYASASVAAIALIVIGITLFSKLQNPDIVPGQELITGELLNNEDIQLITSGEAFFFQNDIEMTLNKEGTAEIIQSNKESSNIKIAQDKFNSLVVPYGKRSIITLADGSKIWLNSGSILEFPAQFSGKKREIRLTSGEIYVEVTPDTEKPFYVQTSNFNVKVHGTQFNVSNYVGSTQSVVLVEGSVSLQSSVKKEIFLTPNQQAVYSSNGTFSTKEVEANQFISWKEGYLTFNKTPMSEVLQQIGRYYNLVFDFENDTNLQKRTCTGKIHLSDNLENVMTTVAILSSTQYKKDNNRIYITNEPKKKNAYEQINTSSTKLKTGRYRKYRPEN